MICVRSDGLSSTQQHRLNSSLQEFVCRTTHDSLSCGVLNEIIQWIIDNFAHYTDKSDNTSSSSGTGSDSSVQKDKVSSTGDFSRLWIYSHHIYNRDKRRAIIDAARELDLTGFSAPGKPGVICVEGCKSRADNFWQQIRSLQWQRITLIHCEDCSLLSDVDSLRRFQTFEEKCFVNPHSATGHGTHLDRGQLLQFLQQHGCKDVFRFYFGIDGKEDSLAEKWTPNKQGLY